MAESAEVTNYDDLVHCFQTLNCGVAIVHSESWEIEFENAHFFDWFHPETGEETRLEQRMPNLDPEKVKQRLARGRPYTFDFDIRNGAKTTSLKISLRYEKVEARELLLVECANVTKQKEAEYMLDSYSRLAEKNARELTREKERVEKLLLNVMPKSVYEEMKDFGTATPQRFDEATVLMLDFVGFTEMAVSRDPSALIAELNDIFSAFDRITDLFGCERIKTIGDAYMAVSGLPEPNADHVSNIAKVALRMRRYLEKRNASNPNQWFCRIGIATGPLIGSLVGIQKYLYDIFGPAVNLAARMEAISAPMEITVSEVTYEYAKDEFLFTDAGSAKVKGFGEQNLFILDGENRSSSGKK